MLFLVLPPNDYSATVSLTRQLAEDCSRNIAVSCDNMESENTPFPHPRGSCLSPRQSTIASITGTPGNATTNMFPALEQTNADNELKGHNHFLTRVVHQELIEASVAAAARDAWWRIVAETDGQMPYPASCTGPDGKLFYSWDQDEHHLELEFASDMLPEFFYRNRRTNELWDGVLGEVFCKDAIEKLTLFFPNQPCPFRHDSIATKS